MTLIRFNSDASHSGLASAIIAQCHSRLCTCPAHKPGRFMHVRGVTHALLARPDAAEGSRSLGSHFLFSHSLARPRNDVIVWIRRTHAQSPPTNSPTHDTKVVLLHHGGRHSARRSRAIICTCSSRCSAACCGSPPTMAESTRSTASGSWHVDSHGGRDGQFTSTQAAPSPSLTCARKHARTHARTRTHTHTHTHTYSHAHTHTHTHTPIASAHCARDLLPLAGHCHVSHGDVHHHGRGRVEFYGTSQRMARHPAAVILG